MCSVRTFRSRRRYCARDPYIAWFKVCCLWRVLVCSISRHSSHKKKLKRSEKAKRKVGLCNYLLCYCGLLLQLQIQLQMQMQMQRTCTVSSNFTSFSGVGLMATRCVRSLLFLSNCVFNFLNKGKDHFHLRRKKVQLLACISEGYSSQEP